jgi:threonine dehydrogenase-like Zn-dependent dehydrogenase
MREPKYNIGQQYKTMGKHSKVCTIIDIYKTYNTNGEMVKLRYVSQHEFCGQIVKDDDVVETTIARGLIKN